MLLHCLFFEDALLQPLVLSHAGTYTGQHPHHPAVLNQGSPSVGSIGKWSTGKWFKPGITLSWVRKELVMKHMMAVTDVSVVADDFLPLLAACRPSQALLKAPLVVAVSMRQWRSWGGWSSGYRWGAGAKDSLHCMVPECYLICLLPGMMASTFAGCNVTDQENGTPTMRLMQPVLSAHPVVSGNLTTWVNAALIWEVQATPSHALPLPTGVLQEMEAAAARSSLPVSDSGKVDYSQDFFGEKAFLTVSGQLNGENLSTETLRSAIKTVGNPAKQLDK